MLTAVQSVAGPPQTTLNVTNASESHYKVTVDDELCGEKVVSGAVQQFTITCKGSGIRGTVIEWTTESPLRNFKFCGYDICAAPEPTINIIGYPSKQSSNWSPDRLAHNANDGNATTCTVTQPYLPGVHQPFWEVDMGGNATIYGLKITNYDHYLMSRLGNVVVTVDGHPCGPSLADAGHLDVRINCPSQPTGRVLRIQLKDAPRQAGVLTLCEVEVFGVAHGELIKNKPEPDTFTAPQIDITGHVTRQSSTLGPAFESKYAVDQNEQTCTESIHKESNQPWWTVDLGANYTVHYIKVINRDNFWNRLGNVVVTLDGKPCGPNMFGATEPILWVVCMVARTDVFPTGKELKIQLMNAPIDGILTLCEVEVYGFPPKKPTTSVKPTPTQTIQPDPTVAFSQIAIDM